MSHDPTTRPSLLARIGANSPEAWGEFVDLYAPLVYGFARRRGLQDADAADLTQEVLRAVFAAAGQLRYDPARGVFRAWLHTVTRNKLTDWSRARRRRPVATGDSNANAALAEVASPAEPDPDWDREYERRVFAWAAEQVRPGFREPTWRAFWLTAVEGRTGEEAARELGLTAGAVQVAKCRVLARLKAVTRPLLDE